MRSTMSSRLPVVALSEWLMVAPATVFLAAAALRLLQPPSYEPARTGWIILPWTTTHISRFGAGILLIVLPGLACVMGCAALLRAWRRDEGFRHDATAVFEALWRQGVLATLTTATLLAGAILVLVVAHGITD